MSSRPRLVHLAVAHGVDKLALHFLGHFGTKTALHMNCVHILRRLVYTHQRIGEVGRPLLTLKDRKVLAVFAADANLSGHNCFVSAPRVSGGIICCGLEYLNLLAQKDLVIAQPGGVLAPRQNCRQTQRKAINGRGYTIDAHRRVGVGIALATSRVELRLRVR